MASLENIVISHDVILGEVRGSDIDRNDDTGITNIGNFNIDDAMRNDAMAIRDEPDKCLASLNK